MEVFPETIHKPLTGFANVELVTALACDSIDYTSRCTVEVSLSLNISVGVGDCCRLFCEVTYVTPGSMARKNSRWCGLDIISTRRQSAMNQDVSETCIPPINAQRLGVENFLCSWVIGQNTGVLEKNFLDFLVLWVVSED